MLLLGNWKMNLSLEEAALLAESYKSLLVKDNLEIAAAPEFLALPAVANVLKGTNIALAGQDAGPALKGSFTGAVSPLNLAELGCRYCIVGHSERRASGETETVIKEKLQAAAEAGLAPILCVGESLTEHQAGTALSFVKDQLTNVLRDLKYPANHALLVAYEPIWAIGSGLTPEPAEVNAIAERIKKEVDSYLPGRKISVLYGGSVSADNVTYFTKQPNLAGCLVGGSSQQANSWTALVQAVADSL